MTLEWDVHMYTEYPEEDLEDLVNSVREHGWDDHKIVESINNTVLGFEDEIYYNWGHEQTMTIVNEVKNRLGGVQLSMFDDEVSNS